MPRLRIAVIGGGLGGMTLANALNQIPHIEVHVYEARSSISDRGAALSLSTNALRALEEIFSPAGKKGLLDRAAAVSLNAVRSIVGSGPNAGRLIYDAPGGDDSEATVHRASLLRELAALIPQENVHTSQRLTAVNPLADNPDEVEVLFDDGSTELFNAIIGADGAFSSVRSHVLEGEGTGDTVAAISAGFWDCRILVPIGKAKASLGDDLFDAPGQYGWVGDGAFVMHDVIEDGSIVHCALSALGDLGNGERKKRLSKEILEHTFSAWLDGPIGRKMINLVLEQDALFAYSQWEHSATSRYNRGNVCIMGDAAHAMTPWQGEGAAAAFEDAMVLQELLRGVQTSSHIPAAFSVFDALRRPRCQRIVDSSRETGLILCGMSQAGLNPEELGGLLSTKWDFIADLDMNEHKREAAMKLKQAI